MREALRATILRVAVAGALLAVAAPAAAAADTEVGVGKADLSWQVDAEQPSSELLTFSGLHSRLWAKAVVVKPPGEEPFAIVRTDTLLITGDLYEGVAMRVARATGLRPERLLLAATHTHTANNGLHPHPVHSALYRSFDPREREFLADRIAAAVAAAHSDARPAKLAAGAGSVSFTDFNRRYTDRESEAAPPYANDPSRIDPEIGVLRFDDAATGEPIAVLMNHGVHPVVTIDERLLSSDLVGFAERELERALPGAMGIWFTGAQGDQDPLHVRHSYPEAEWAGGVLGREAGRVARRLRPDEITSARVAEKVIPLPGPGDEQPTLGVGGIGRVPIPAPAPLTVPSSVRLQAVELAARGSGSTALMTWPGEPIRDLGVALKTAVEGLGFDRAYVLGLSNDWGGYWLTPDEYERGLYEWTLAFYGPRSALYVHEQLVDLADALAHGTATAPVPLPPKAQLDRELTRASALAGAPPFEAPPPDPEPRIEREPAGVSRAEVARMAWSGGSPRVALGWFPRVLVERRERGEWVEHAREGAGEVLLRHEGDSRWSARWQPTRSAPAGTYRVRILGNRQTEGGPVAYELVSTAFEVRPCRCVEPGALRVRRVAGGYRLGVTARYTPGPADGFRLLPDRVRNGRAVVRVLRDGREVGRVRLRPRRTRGTAQRRVMVRNVDDRTLPVTTREPVERVAFRGGWRGGGGVRFELVTLVDRYGNR